MSEDEGVFVAASEIAIAEEGAPRLEEAFEDRLGEVEDWPGFLGLEVWRDQHEAGRYLMVSWWRDEADFKAYMASAAHRRSHARIPDDPARPRPAGLSRYEVVAR